MPLKKIQILVIDDDSHVFHMLKDYYEQWSFLHAKNKYESKKILNTNNPIDCVLLDYKLTNITGFELVESIKKSRPSIPIIMITAHATKQIAIQAIDHQIDGFIEKPLNFDYLEKKIKTILKNYHLLTDNDSYNEFINLLLKKPTFNMSESLQDIAKKNNLNYKYLSKQIHEKTGQKYRQIRIEKTLTLAKKLLKKSSHPIHYIAKECGYQHSSAFAFMFKNEVGITPKQYRQNHS